MRKEARGMYLKDEILAGELYSFGFKFSPNEDRIKCLEMAVTFADGRGEIGMKENRNERRRT